MPAIAPGIALELSLSHRNADLLQRDADIAIRMARPTQSRLIARRIGAVKLGLFAHRRYVEIRGLPRSLEELARHRQIRFDRDLHVPRTAGGAAAALRQSEFDIRTDNVAAQAALLRAGVGITVCHLNVARSGPEPRSGPDQAIHLRAGVVASHTPGPTAHAPRPPAVGSPGGWPDALRAGMSCDGAR